jgi:hypothetical protein
VVGPISPDAQFEVEDYEMLIDTELKKRILPVARAIQSLGLDISDERDKDEDVETAEIDAIAKDVDVDLLTKVSSVLGSDSSKDTSNIFDYGKDKSRARVYRDLRGEFR